MQPAHHERLIAAAETNPINHDARRQSCCSTVIA